MYNRIKKASKDAYYETLFSECGHNLRETWNVIWQLLGKIKDKSSITECFNINKQYVSDKTTIANEICR